MVGKTLGHYEILEPLGAGGMGEVYRARDTKLDRDVAIKVLPEDFATDEDRLARFEREAKLLASLNHANIATIHGLEDADGVRFIAMECVEGETLAERLARSGPVEVDEALDIARQIAEALEAAHENGVIHRDLKPANVVVTPDGKAKVLDFGLAKSFEAEASSFDVSPDLSHSPTMMEATRAGVIMGTAAYMSPEQAKGKPLDKRTDIWSFGAVLYEMLTGQSAFGAEDVSDTLAAILKDEPDWAALPTSLPATAAALLRRCLRKQRKSRLRDIADARIEIVEAIEEPEVVGVASGPSPGTAPTRPGRFAPWAVAIIATLIAVSAGYRMSTLPEAELLHVSALPTHASPLLGGNRFPPFAISPDGSRLAYWVRDEDRSRLMLKSWDQLEGSQIADSSFASRSSGLFFSPDGEQIGFVHDGKLWRMPAEGGAPVEVAELPERTLRGASWGSDGNIVFAGGPNVGLSMVGYRGGEEIVNLTTPNPERGEISHRLPEVLPGGDAVLFVAAHGGNTGEANIAVYSFDTGETTILPNIRGTSPRYVPTGHLLYSTSDALFAVGFDPDTLEVTGAPMSVLDSIHAPYLGQAAAHYDVAENGTIVYVPYSQGEYEIVVMTREGAAHPLPVETGFYFAGLDVSEDGRLLALQRSREVSVYDFERETLTPIWDEHQSFNSVWRPGADSLIFNASKEGEFNLFEIPVDGSGSAERLTVTPQRQYPTSVSPSGGVVLLIQFDIQANADILALQMDGRSSPEPLVQTGANEGSAVFSPDGTHFAYSSDATGRDEIYVMRYSPEATQRRGERISTTGGMMPRWSRDGRELFFVGENRLMVSSVRTEPDFAFETPSDLLPLGPDISFNVANRPASYDVLPDGAGFVFVREVRAPPTQSLLVKFNWFEELSLVPTGR